MFEAIGNPETSRLLGNPYGYFEAETGAFVVTDILTPRPWVNVLANARYGLVISQAGGGFSWSGNCQLFRLSRWEQDLVQDSYGRFLYVQDLDAPEELWSTTYQPTRRRAEHDLVRHEIGATTFIRRFRDIETEQTIFVPPEMNGEVWLVNVSNRGRSPKRLRMASYLEWHLGSVGDWHREFHRLFVESRRHGNTLVAWKHAGLAEHRREEPRSPLFAFVSWSGVDSVRWISDKKEWLGPEGDPSSPKGLAQDVFESDTPRWDDPIAAGLTELSLAPGETRSLVLTIGVGENERGALELARRLNPDSALEALKRTRDYWQSICVQPGDDIGIAEVDLMANRWLPYQTIAARLYGRCAFYQQGGAYGYRDQLQDSLLFLDRDPGATLTQLGRHAEAMYSDGGVRHWWHPDTDIFAESRHSDTCLWLAYGVLAYLEQTGDMNALDRDYGFLDRSTQRLGEHGTLRAHCIRGIDRCLSCMSPRGLPLIEAGDWNDGLSHAGIEGRGESVWLAMFLYDVLRRWLPYASAELAVRFRGECDRLQSAVNEHAWDGEWYIGGTRDDGRPFGSRSCEEGQIFLNPQTWAVISSIAPDDRIQQAMESVRKRLLTPYGALLLQPAYSHVDPYIGYITRYAPGLRENGGVYSHASAWAAMAFAMMGDKETARKIYQAMLPPLRAAEDADLYAAEPYVMPGNVDGPDSPYAGRAGWTWYTGSAAWMVRIRKLIEP